MWHSLVVVASLLASTGVKGQQEQQSVFLLGHHFDQYDFSCAAGLVAALSEDKYSVLFYNVINQSFGFEKKLIFLGQPLNWSLEGETLFLAHASYITVMYNGDRKQCQYQW